MPGADTQSKRMSILGMAPIADGDLDSVADRMAIADMYNANPVTSIESVASHKMLMLGVGK